MRRSILRVDVVSVGLAGLSVFAFDLVPYLEGLSLSGTPSMKTRSVIEAPALAGYQTYRETAFACGT